MMKKALVCLLLVALTVSSAFGESQTNQTSGIYVEGRDIEAGTYSFSCNSVTNAYCVVATFADEEHYNQFAEDDSIVDGLKSNSTYYTTLRKDEDCDFQVDEGNILMIEYGEGTLTLKQSAREAQPQEKEPSSEAHDALLSALRSTELTSGEKLMMKMRNIVESEGMDAAIESCKAGLISNGFSSEQAEEILLKAQFGEEIHPFHKVDYSIYNVPAEDNGLENDTIFVDGIIQKYVSDGNKRNCTYGLVVEQEDGNQWLIYCAEKINRELIGIRIGSEPEQHVFEGYDGRTVRIYGKYLGYSEKYKLPVIDIVTYGGMVLIDENTLIITNTSDYYMNMDHISDFGYLISAEKCIQSYERPWFR